MDKKDGSKRISGIAGQAGRIDKLLERDKQREKDGFPKKIKVGRMVKEATDGTRKTIVVPIASEDKFLHDTNFLPENGRAAGTGSEEEGDVIGEKSLHDAGGQSGAGGEGKESEHQMEDLARQFSQILVEEFGLPNLKDKGMRPSLNKYIYDLTDLNVGAGQFLDKQATLKRITKTNVSLGNINVNNIDPSSFVISPDDKVYRVVSREKVYESQAVVFFVRDYSGSMYKSRTQIVCNLHFLFYSWLISQYHDRVEKRYILHDTQAVEVPDFYTYSNSRVAGGTRVAEAYKLINKIIAEENLEANFNIYVFHGTDGDDWDEGGQQTIPHIQETVSCANRLGITVVFSPADRGKDALTVYLEKSGLLLRNRDSFRLDRIPENAGDEEMIKSMKILTED